jgi:hypothetical protein
MRCRLNLAAVASAAAIADTCTNAQPLETMTLSIEWDWPVISHGQTNTGKILATMSPKIGSTVAWNTPPGKGQPGILIAFMSASFDLQGISNALNGTLAWTIPAEFDIANKPGVPDGEGGIKGTITGQFIGNPNPFPPNTNQTVTILELEWTESAGGDSYEVNFASKMLTAKVGLDVGLSSIVGENAVKIDGQGGFNVIPAPSAIVLAPLAVAGLTRRRRRSTVLA